MKNAFFKIILMTAVIVLILTSLCGCGAPKDTESTVPDDTSSQVSSMYTGDASKASIQSVASIADRSTLSDDDIEYLKKLFSCLPYTSYTSKYELDDQKCMQYLESIINYQDTTSDNFFFTPVSDGKGNFTVSKEAAENFCKSIFNFTMEHTSDYLTGDNYFFPASSAAKIPVVEFTKTSTVGVIFQIEYTTTFDSSDPVKHIASVYRTTNSEYPFRIQSMTINS